MPPIDYPTIIDGGFKPNSENDNTYLNRRAA